MKRPPGMPVQPGMNLRCPVCRGVVENNMHVAIFGELPGNGIEEVDEFLGPVAVHALPDHCCIASINVKSLHWVFSSVLIKPNMWISCIRPSNEITPTSMVDPCNRQKNLKLSISPRSQESHPDCHKPPSTPCACPRSGSFSVFSSDHA